MAMTSSSHIWMIHGPTASGKTSLAIELAQTLGTEIVSCDARQLYQEMSIGVARPSKEELATVTHHGIASHSIHEALTAGSYASWGRPLVQALLDKHGSAVVVGGSGLYAKNLLFAMDDLPPADEKLRMTLEKQWQADPQPLINQLKAKDPAYAATADLKNSRRVLRALEVIKLTGKTYSSQRTQAIAQPAFQAHIHQIAIWPGMPELEAVIAHRTNSMMQKGLREEAMSLKTHQLLVPLQTVGYREFYQNPTGDDKALEEKITLRTRQYAKRQLTWLKKQDVHRIPIRSSVNDLFKLAAS